MTLDQLRPADMVYLHALLCGSHGKKWLHPVPSSVAPNEAYYLHLLGTLERRGLLIAATGHRAAVMGSYPVPVAPLVGLDSGLPPADELKPALEVRLKSIRRDPSAVPAYHLIWQELALAELQAYLEWELASHRFDTRWGDALGHVFEDGLKQFSIGQMFYFCWTSVRDLASHHLRNPSPLETYKEYLYQALFGRLRRAASQEWDVRQYSRQWRRRTNAVAETFSTHATTLGERYLTAPPSGDALSSLF